MEPAHAPAQRTGPGAANPGSPRRPRRPRIVVGVDGSPGARAALVSAGTVVDVVALAGGAAETLVQRAESADLLVVGSRSRSRLRGMVLGSVALHCVVHPPCPVMVVRRRPPARTTDPAAVPAAAHG